MTFPDPPTSSSDAHAAAAMPHEMGLMGRVLPTAIKLWLRSQVEHVEHLELTIEGRDLQILSGYLPQVQIAAQGVIYQGLHLTAAQVTGTNIRINLGQVLRGKPLRLLEIVPVTGHVSLTEADLNQSLVDSPLSQAISEFLVMLLQTGGAIEDLSTDATADPAQLELEHVQFQLQPDSLVLTANLKTASGEPTLLALRASLVVQDGSVLVLKDPIWLPHAKARRGLPLDDLNGYAIDLGSDVNLTELTLADQRLTCAGTINVIPA